MFEPKSGICGTEIQIQRVDLNDPWHVEIFKIPEGILFHVKLNQRIL